MQRIYAGVAGGKRYFYGEDNKLFDEAGVEQPEAYAAVLKANFPPAPGTFNTPPGSPQPSNQNNPNQAGQTPNPRPEQRSQSSSRPGKTMGQQVAADILRIAFPDLYQSVKKYRSAAKKSKRKKNQYKNADKKKKDDTKQGNSAPSDSNRKQWERELSLKIESVASSVRSNGELMRQQLTMQERSIELLRQISQGTGNKSGDGSVSSKITSSLGALKKFILPTLGAAGVVAAGGAALYMSSQNKNHTRELQLEEDTEKYGEEKANDLDKTRHESTIEKAKRVWDMADTRKPAERAAAQRASREGLPPPQPGDAQKDTKAISAAKERKPSGRGKTITSEQLTFDAKTIKLEARTISINTGSSSSLSGTGTGSGGASAQSGGGGGSAQSGGGGNQPDYGSGASPGAKASGSGPDTAGGGIAPAVSDGTRPAGSVFKPDITTPFSPGSDNPKAPGYGGIAGGIGATTMGGQLMDPAGGAATGEAIRKADIAPTQGFRPVGDISSFDGKSKSSEGSFGTLADQRTGMMDQINKDSSLRDRAAAMMVAEEGGDSHSRHALLETAMNRAASTKKDIGTILGSTGYYAPYKDGGYARAQAKLAADPKLREQVYKEIDAVGKGSNFSKLGTDNASAHVKANALARGDTMTYEGKNKEGFFRKDKNPSIHGVGRVKQDQKWAAQTQAAMDRENAERAKQTPEMNKKSGLTGGGVTPDMDKLFSKQSVTDMPGMGGIKGAVKAIEPVAEKIESKASDERAREINSDLRNQDRQLKQNKSPFISETANGDSGRAEQSYPPTLPQGKFTDELIENKLNDEAGIQRWLGWKQIGPGVQRRKELSVNPFTNEPGPLEAPRPIESPITSPGEIPESKNDAVDTEGSGGEAGEKTQGSKAKVTDHVGGANKPKSIRQIDMGKYYPQYPKSDFGDSTIGVGIGVA